MKGARRPERSEMTATLTVVMKAKAYGGIVRSWALAAVYPRLLMMVGWDAESAEPRSCQQQSGGLHLR